MNNVTRISHLNCFAPELGKFTEGILREDRDVLRVGIRGCDI